MNKTTKELKGWRGFGLAICLSSAAVLTTTGCATLKVTSEPADGRVIWSSNGIDWQSWPPNSFQFSSLKSEERKNSTPLKTSGLFGETIFVTVEKEGYRTPLPQLAQLYTFRRESFDFKLDELPETYMERMEREGFVRYQNEWVLPEEKGLSQFQGVWLPAQEAYRQEQLLKGLIEYNGEWMSVEEAAAQERKDKLAVGLIEFKGRWITSEQMELEKTIDEDVAALEAAKDSPDLPAPKVLGQVRHEASQIHLYNSSGQSVVFLFSGPVSRRYVVEPYDAVGVRSDDRVIIPSGRYKIAAVPSGSDATGIDLADVLALNDHDAETLKTVSQFASWPFASGMEYSFNYSGKTLDLSESLKNFEMPELDMDINIPEIEIPEMPKSEQPSRSGQRPGGPRGGGGGGGRP